MRIGTYQQDESPRVGFAIDDWILDLVEVCHLVKKDIPDTSTLVKTVESGGVLALLEGGEALLNLARRVAREAQSLVKKDGKFYLFGKIVFHAQEVSLMAPIP